MRPGKEVTKDEGDVETAQHRGDDGGWMGNHEMQHGIIICVGAKY